MWRGRSSDKACEGCLYLIQPGETIIVDTGFLVEEVVPRGGKLYMPALTASQSKLSAAKVTQTQPIV